MPPLDKQADKMWTAAQSEAGSHFRKTRPSGKFDKWEIFPEQEKAETRIITSPTVELGMDNPTEGQFSEEHFKTEQFKADL